VGAQWGPLSHPLGARAQRVGVPPPRGVGGWLGRRGPRRAGWGVGGWVRRGAVLRRLELQTSFCAADLLIGKLAGVDSRGNRRRRFMRSRACS
jgi:hypothetical protein